MIGALTKRVLVGGTTNIVQGTTLVSVNVSTAPVTIQLPSAISLPAGTQPTKIAGQPLTVVDSGGNAVTRNITILPFGSETIMGLASVVIANNFGSYTLVPDEVNGGWVQQ
jgi:molecular chaperone DnaK (HSP70)